jgi:1-acyl-sn-glycerol-3-phosphate acyltransferase
MYKVPPRGPLIAYSNHTGQIEVAVLFGQLQPRPITAWAKIEAWNNAFLRWLFNLWGVIPVKRGEADTSALRKAVDAIQKGFIFGVAPEGTRNITGQLRRAHPGVVMLAILARAPLLPIAHWGGESLLKNLAHFSRTDFHIRVGKAFCLKVEGIKMTREIRQQIADEMMFRLVELLPPEYRGEYADISGNQKIFTEECETKTT